MKNFVKENWFKITTIILIVWFLVIISNITFSDSFSVDVCLKEASTLPSAVPLRCW
jgi:uncharacterized membrane protein